MGGTIGALSKLAVRIESDAGMVSGAYPTTEATADTEEVLLKSSDLVPFLSEGIEEQFTWSVDETLDGSPGAESSDNISILDDGSLSIGGYYDGMNALIACAMGFELPDATNSPAPQNGTALTSTSSGATSYKDATNPFASGDVGKFIQVQSGAAEGQVRRISAFVGAGEVTVTPAWDSNPANGTTAVMAEEWKHLFELSNDLSDELWTTVYSSYPTGGVGTANDQIFRRMTLGVLKHSTTPQIHRSVMVNTMNLSFNVTDGLKSQFELMGFNKDLASSTNGANSADNWALDNASDLFVENERIVFPDVDYFRIDAFANGALTSDDNYGIDAFDLTINNQLKGDDQSADTGVFREQPCRNAMREVTGSFKIPRHNTDQFETWLKAKTELTLKLSLSGSTIEANARNMSIYIPRLKLESVVTPVGGPNIVPITVNFRAFSPQTALAAVAPYNTVGLTAPRSEVLIELLNSYPFNAFRDQQKEY